MTPSWPLFIQPFDSRVPSFVQAIVTSSCSLALGCLLGGIKGGLVSAIATLAVCILLSLADSVAQNAGWTKRTFFFVTAAIEVLVPTLFIISMVAFNVIFPACMGLIITSGSLAAVARLCLAILPRSREQIEAAVQA